jgi:ferredoxin-like protein FixX
MIQRVFSQLGEDTPRICCGDFNMHIEPLAKKLDINNPMPVYNPSDLKQITLSTSPSLTHDVVGFGKSDMLETITVSDVKVDTIYPQSEAILSSSDRYWETLKMNTAMQNYASDHKLLRGECDTYNSFLNLYTFNLYGLEPAMKHGFEDDDFERRRNYDTEAKNDYQLDLFVQLFKQAQKDTKMCVIGLQEVDICPAKLLYSLKNGQLMVDKQSLFEKITGKIFDDECITVDFTSPRDRQHMVDSLRLQTPMVDSLRLQTPIAQILELSRRVTKLESERG